jgi:hypothetical protein
MSTKLLLDGSVSNSSKWNEFLILLPLPNIIIPYTDKSVHLRFLIQQQPCRESRATSDENECTSLLSKFDVHFIRVTSQRSQRRCPEDGNGDFAWW